MQRMNLLVWLPSLFSTGLLGLSLFLNSYLRIREGLPLIYLYLGTIVPVSLLLLRQMMNSVLLLTPLLLAAALWGVTLVWLLPVLVRRGGTIGQVLRSAFLLGLGELWRSLAALALWVLPGIVFLFYARTFLRLAPLWLLLYFALAARLTMALQEPAFRKKP